MSRFRKRHPKAGAPPGTLMISESDAKPRVTYMAYTAEGSIEEGAVAQVARLRQLRAGAGTLWVDIQGIGDEALLREIGEIFDVHPLALEDVVNVPQRPKVDHYDEHMLIVTRMIRMKSATVLDVEQVSVFVGENYVLTFQERHGDVLDPVRARLRKGTGPIRRLGADYLAYALIDTVVDAYYPVLEAIGDLLEDLEEEIVQHPRQSLLRQIYAARRELLTMRRAVWPMREAIYSIVRSEEEDFSAEARVYLRDTLDHCAQILDATESNRELVTGLMDMYLSTISNRQNEIMKVLTVIASIFVPLTFLAGIYGMNFADMPELHYRWGYPALLTLMAAVAIGMLAYFWKLGWLRREDA
ncbi:MAG: magnesium/cobalt transporter CorA [Phycisphaerales bacterium]|nr:magnesium/cobalt transporter CorA [Phycisphaerales bacterium]